MSETLNKKQHKHAGIIFVVLAALFIAALITCNLVANKFVEVDLGFKTFIVSAGVIPYPLTFLITDILSEIYGRRNTGLVVLSGFFASLLVLLILYLGHIFPAIDGSPVSNEYFDTVFQNSWRVIASSMIAYLVAQFVDVRIFHLIKQKTKGKHLWLRNNFSTMFSQLVDTVLVIAVIFWGLKSFDEMLPLIGDGWLFKVLFAAADTIIIYPLVLWIRAHFKLQRGEEIALW
ncbi:queuosine precursor transporter [Croceimicrobium sp.]|uniref:queuosine precursor transporter n=1 Tax=Croceimicrobium sp. TaxID=2828340 RepID=UPI003BAA3BC5